MPDPSRKDNTVNGIWGLVLVVPPILPSLRFHTGTNDLASCRSMVGDLLHNPDQSLRSTQVIPSKTLRQRVLAPSNTRSLKLVFQIFLIQRSEEDRCLHVHQHLHLPKSLLIELHRQTGNV